MFQKFLEFAQSLLLLSHQTEQNTQEIRKLREELDAMSKVVSEVVVEMRHQRENEERDRQLLLAQVELMLLRERQLPPSP